VKLNLAQKLWLPTLALALTVVLAFVATLSTTRSNIDAALSADRGQQRQSEAVLQWIGLAETAAAQSAAALLAADAQAGAHLAAQAQALQAQIDTLRGEVEALARSDDERAALQRIGQAREGLGAALAEAARVHAGADPAATAAFVQQRLAPAQAAQADALRQLAGLQQARSEALRAEQAAARMRVVWAVGAVMFAMAALLIAATAFVARAILQPLREAVGHAERIGAGDLSVALQTARRDELGDLLRALDRMQQGLGGVVLRVREATDSIGVASREVASGNQDLSGRTEQTAANLQQAASSMEQLTGTVAHSADSAAQANQLASSAADVARRGGSVVAQVVSTMDDISASSKKIADIIGVIDGIAFQTNILALNAAVEAARAGEQGRGFAVVAAEVRSLAQRSAEAAKEIKALIGSSVDKVEAGSRLVGDAGSTMTEIVASVQRVADIIGEISAAAREQSSGIGQVNSAVADLDRMTQQNAALVEQSAAAAHSLEEQARRLTQVVATFRVDAGATAAA
jgi:methyl-accepting chemotaxis protein